MIFVLLAVSTFHFANSLYRISPDASVANNVQVPQEGLRTQSETNVTNATFTIENSSLKISAIRVANSEGSAFFDVGATVAAPLYPDLNIMYSMYPATASSVFGLRLFNGTHVVVLQYYVGNETLEHPYQNYIDVQYQIGNATATWFKGTRNIWDDLANEGVDVSTSWKTTTVGFGLASFSLDNSTDDSSMHAVFELNETQLVYSESRLALVDSSSITFSRTAFLGLLVSAAAFVALSGEYLILLRRTRQS